jgi:hypothetical protein
MRRILVWAMVAAAAVTAVAFLALTEKGAERLRAAFSVEKPEPLPLRIPETERLSAALAQAEREIRHLADALDLLTADRSRLVARIESIERGLEVTGSIGPASTSGPPPKFWMTEIGRPDPGTRLDLGEFGLGSAGAAADSVSTTTEFGLDLGSGPTIEALRSRWTELREKHAAMLGKLRPVVSVLDRGGGIELRLVAGPLPNAAAAARLCGVLAAASLSCQPAVFDGQRLALR